MPHFGELTPGKVPDALYDYGGVYWHWLAESIDGFFTAGAGVVSLIGGILMVQSGAVIGDEMMAYHNPSQLYMLNRPMTWDRRRRFKTRGWIGGVANQTMWIIMGGATIAAPGTMHVGFKVVNNQIFGSVGNGLAETLTPAICTFVAGGGRDYFRFEAVHIPGRRAEFYLEDHAGNAWTATLAAGLPSGTDLASECTLLFINVITAEANIKDFWCSEWFFQEYP